MWYLILSIALLIAVTVLIIKANDDGEAIALFLALTWLGGTFLLWGIGYPLLRLTTGFYEDYSRGERQGYLTKFSEKGIIFKTLEGEMQVGTGAMAALQEPWAFSVPRNNQFLDKQIQANLGKHVRITYTQYLLMPWRYGETEYLVTSVTPLAPKTEQP